MAEELFRCRCFSRSRFSFANYGTKLYILRIWKVQENDIEAMTKRLRQREVRNKIPDNCLIALASKKNLGSMIIS